MTGGLQQHDKRSRTASSCSDRRSRAAVLQSHSRSDNASYHAWADLKPGAREGPPKAENFGREEYTQWEMGTPVNNNNNIVRANKPNITVTSTTTALNWLLRYASHGSRKGHRAHGTPLHKRWPHLSIFSCQAWRVRGDGCPHTRDQEPQQDTLTRGRSRTQ